MAVTTNSIVIKIDGFDITNCVESPITINERLDEVLDSSTFTLIVSKKPSVFPKYIPFNKLFTKAIEPFTLCQINSSLYGNKYYYASSECKKLMYTDKYMHSVTLYELTKRLETFILGSKSFSHISNVTNYNSDYHRIRIITELMNDKYNVNITLSNALESKFTKEREYSFGAGTTMFDALKEIMANTNCIPRVDYDGTNLILTYDDIDVLTNGDLVNFDDELIESIDSTQSVDEYCTEVETEMSDVCGSLDPTSVVVSARGQEDVFTKDTACLVLPSNVDSIKSIEILSNVYTANNDGAYIKTGLTMSSKIYSTINGTLIYSYSTLATTIMDDFGNDVWQEVNDIIINQYGASTAAKFTLAALNTGTIAIGFKKAVYDDSGDDITEYLSYSASNEPFDITNYLLNQEQYQLLEVLKQPYYIYYTHGGNQINGFYNVQNDDFWKSLIYGTTPSFMSLVMLTPDKKFGYVNSADIIGKVFKVTYYPISELYVRQSKTNETPKYVTARSYNNGSSSVDFKQLMPEIEKNANLLGLEMKTITSVQNLPVGTKTQYGYIINKSMNFNITNNQVITSIVYNCSSNNKIIAEALSRATQYEATNLPLTGVITRHIDLSVSYNELKEAGLVDSSGLFYLYIKDYNLAKPLTIMDTLDETIMICETLDNYAFDNKVEKGENNYYKNMPVAYSDSNNFQKTYNLELVLADTESLTQSELVNEKVTYPVLDALPNVTSEEALGGSSVKKLILNSSKLVYKDSRERLIFNIRVEE